MGSDDVTLNAKECEAWVAKAKPCPFCGCDKIRMYTNEAAVVQCRNRDCLAKISKYMENEYPDGCKNFKDYLNWLAQKALDKWNRRA
jgi:hypothetical protein